MSTAAANPYLRTKILTASPHELRLMLYDGAIKFCRQAKDAMAKKEIEQSYNALMRAQKIVLELSTSLNADMDADLYAKLSALYTYIYRLLVDANIERTPAKVDEAVGLIEYEKETWQLLMKKVAQSAEPAADTGAQQTAMSSLSTNA